MSLGCGGACAPTWTTRSGATGRKETWHTHPDPDTRRKLTLLLYRYIHDMGVQTNYWIRVSQQQQRRCRNRAAEFGDMVLRMEKDPKHFFECPDPKEKMDRRMKEREVKEKRRSSFKRDTD